MQQDPNDPKPSGNGPEKYSTTTESTQADGEPNSDKNLDNHGSRVIRKTSYPRPTQIDEICYDGIGVSKKLIELLRTSDGIDIQQLARKTRMSTVDCRNQIQVMVKAGSPIKILGHRKSGKPVFRLFD